MIYSNPRIICESLTPSPWVRGGLGWGKKFTTPARIAIFGISSLMTVHQYLFSTTESVRGFGVVCA